MKLEIIKVPDPRLRQKSKNLKPEEIKKIKSLISNMVETMYANDGIGLAAPQIGQNIRLAVIGKQALPTGRQALPNKKELVLINPKISKRSWRQIKDFEGCLSVPGAAIEVKRHKKITVTALNEKAERVSYVVSDYLARVFQHEIDHLDGILIIDKNEKTN